ncbi:hypothetical protein MsAg5_06460 [Methanosarcinaceae archaeon Ag5]|uniref:Uncharacterized protein n=1 Tax=Methanolapillus africanus TaxID=3028297 RepID=A0AAE4MHN8_9EURY|nr:hypothetical protein [Methanosarcinaceae archaeon Ag5]
MTELFVIFAILSLIAITTAPLLLISAIKKVYNQKSPVLECVLLVIDGFCFWFWLLMVFGSLPTP